MTWRADLWSRFAAPQYWWIHAMVAVMLFVIEPPFLHRRMERSLHPARDLGRMERMRWLLCVASVVTLLGAVVAATDGSSDPPQARSPSG